MNYLPTILVFAGLVAAPSAQGSGSQGTIPTISGVVPVAGAVVASDAPMVPPPPRSILGPLAPKQTPQLRFTPGAATDLAPGAPSTPNGASGAVPAGGQLVTRDNHAVLPAGAAVHQTTPEPTAAIHRDTAFFTGNFYAAISESSGRTWSYINPYTVFPAADGGFCCDQSTQYVPGNDSNCMLIWQLQYYYSASTGTGRHRIAVATGRDALRRRAFIYYDLTPQLVGFSANRWFDFPDLGVTANWLYVASNVFDQNSLFQGTSVVRLNLNDMRAGRAANFNAATTGVLDPASHRLCDGTTTTMYYGAHHRSILGAPLIRIFSWPETSSTVTFNDRAISAWYTGTSSAPGPDNRDWLARDDHRIQGAYLASGAISFMWGSNRGGSFPMPFVRIAGFAESNFNLIGEASVWNPSMAFAYPSVAANAAGNVGGTMCYGGGASTPGTVAWVVDALSGWGPLTNTVVAAGWSGPAQNAWGDYLSATRHPAYPNTYVGSAFSIDATNTMTPRFAWFGRENDMPNFATVNVTSTPTTGVAITVDVPDRNGNQNGSTNFSRVYSAVQGMTWTAPAQASVGGINYTFDRWRLNATLQPAGQLTLTIPDLSAHGLVNNIEARYVPVRRTLTVVSTPTAGATVGVNPPDLNNRLQGQAPFTLEYSDGASFSAFAPATLGTNGVFDRWLVDGVARTTSTTLSVTVSGNHTLTAQYRFPLCGSFTAYGQSCNTSIGLQHTGSSSRATCGPWIGDSVNYGVVNAYSNASGALFLGASRTVWNGIPLPIPVGLPNQANCFIYTDMLLTLPFATTGFPGSGGVNGLVLPNNPGLVNARLFTQCVVLSQLGFHQWSHGLETLIGGFQ